MSDTNPDLAAQEVDDELRRDQLNAMWKAYGRYIIGGAVGIVLAVGGTQLYKYQVRSGQESNSAQFGTASIEAVTAQDSAAIWVDAGKKLDAGYAALAQLNAAAALAKAGDFQGAIDAYDALAASTDGDIVLREYAQLLAGLLVVDKTEDLDAARGRFSALASPDQPWYFSATEQLAFLDMKQGEIATAYDLFASLADNTSTPKSIGVRARQFRDMLERQLPRDTSLPVEEEQPEVTETPNEG